MRTRLQAVLGLCWLILAAPALAQDPDRDDPVAEGAVLPQAQPVVPFGPSLPMTIAPQDPVVLLDRQRFYEGSRLGQVLAKRIETQSLALAAENRRLEAELEAQEKDLTAKRGRLRPEEFRRLADEFDAHVDELRQSQDAKTRAIAQARDAAYQDFTALSLPILAKMMQDIGAVAILDHAAVILSFERIDITKAAIARLDQAYEAGEITLPDPEDLPAEAPSAGPADAKADLEAEPKPSAPVEPSP